MPTHDPEALWASLGDQVANEELRDGYQKVTNKGMSGDTEPDNGQPGN